MPPHIDNPLNLRILIVEDSPERQLFLRELYRHHTTQVVTTCDDALQALSTAPFDIVHLDFDLIEETTARVAEYLAGDTTDSLIVIHSDNPLGAVHLQALLPNAVVLPISLLRRPSEDLSKLKNLLASSIGNDTAAIKALFRNWLR